MTVCVRQMSLGIWSFSSYISLNGSYGIFFMASIWSLYGLFCWLLSSYETITQIEGHLLFVRRL